MLFDSLAHLFTAPARPTIDHDKVYKILHGSMNNRGFQYKVGHNKMGGDFFPEMGSDGGLYCYRGYILLGFLYDYDDTDALIAEVTLPPTALYLEEHGLIKAEEFVLGEPRPVLEYLTGLTHLDIVKRHPLNIKFFSTPSYAAQEYVLNQYPSLVGSIKNADPMIIELATKYASISLAQ